MGHQGHSYKLGVRGRSTTTRPGIGGPTTTAHLQCATCGKIGERKLRMLMPPEQIDQKFAQAGWALDPHACPDCRAQRTKEKTMATKPSPAAMKAQVQMIGLLSEHFDTDAGTYAAGWSDKKIASETGVAPATVAEFRIAGFGEIKEPEAISALRADINALDQLTREHHGTVQAEIASLRAKLAQVTAKVAA